jgi:hypothetical protein
MTTELELEAADLEQCIRHERDAASRCWAAHDDEGNEAHMKAAARMQARLAVVNAQLEAETANVH